MDRTGYAAIYNEKLARIDSDAPLPGDTELDQLEIEGLGGYQETRQFLDEYWGVYKQIAANYCRIPNSDREEGEVVVTRAEAPYVGREVKKIGRSGPEVPLGATDDGTPLVARFEIYATAEQGWNSPWDEDGPRRSFWHFPEVYGFGVKVYAKDPQVGDIKLAGFSSTRLAEFSRLRDFDDEQELRTLEISADERSTISEIADILDLAEQQRQAQAA